MRTILTRKLSLLGAVSALGLATMPATAGAQTSATCILNGGSVRCVGTIADRAVSIKNAEGSLQVRGARANLLIRAWPLISILTQGLGVTGELACVPAPAPISCSGTGETGKQPVSIHTTGAVDGSSALINLADPPGAA